MTKPELIEELSAKTGLQKKDAEAFLKALTETVTKELSEKNQVSLVGFGTFSAVEVAERTGIVQLGANKGETYTTPAHWKPKFKPGKTLIDAVKG
ncbi:HU family DNA-binding protein [Clostridium sp. 3-3]|nr:HU family DNA-binding protein [Clostridium sp. 3-3]